MAKVLQKKLFFWTSIRIRIKDHLACVCLCLLSAWQLLRFLITFLFIGGLLAAPKTAEVLDLLHSSLNSDAVDDFWIGLDDA